MPLNAGDCSSPRRRKLIFSTAAPNSLSFSAFGFPTMSLLASVVLREIVHRKPLPRHRHHLVRRQHHATEAALALRAGAHPLDLVGGLQQPTALDRAERHHRVESPGARRPLGPIAVSYTHLR